MADGERDGLICDDQEDGLTDDESVFLIPEDFCGYRLEFTA